MSIESLLDHKCNIYHLQSSTETGTYGLPTTPKFEYNSTPDKTNVPCHFKEVTALSIQKQEPGKEVVGDIYCTFALTEDIRQNDRIVDTVSNVKYIAHIPRLIRDHHIKVKLQPDGVFL